MTTPNQIVSLSGPTKTGKTVLAKKVLGNREYVWIDGGEVDDAAGFWDQVCSDSHDSHSDSVAVETGQGGAILPGRIRPASGQRRVRGVERLAEFIDRRLPVTIFGL
jgi:hypothetical protein